MQPAFRRENPVAARSRAALIAAADTLLNHSPAAEISVTTVVSTAGMSRPTFYQHFTDLGSLFAAAGSARLAQVFAAISGNSGDQIAELIAAVESDAQFYWHIYDGPSGMEFHAHAVKLTAGWLYSRSGAVEYDDNLWDFLAAGVVWTLTKHVAAVANNPQAHIVSPADDLNRILDSVSAFPAHNVS
ncbi:transcriptional regulator, TetR family [Corynebacterium mustelae]|uniref:Transcriptional regulator, TetR family n=1 Tax=Corynebacterium mustelae TaxID=571915 RepID=A0A0G3H288_9CORY|nr:TetR/AcrR family transcriptional regulator [Corynebacterium mustelae]AKK06865.1 transcriptional regulator, TetR family [Corynebacterium mustelae]